MILNFVNATVKKSKEIIPPPLLPPLLRQPNTKSRFWSTKKNWNSESKMQIQGFSMLAISNFQVQNRNSKGVGENDFQIFEIKLQGLGFRNFRIQGFQKSILGFWVFGCRIQGLRFRNFKFRVQRFQISRQGFQRSIFKF